MRTPQQLCLWPNKRAHVAPNLKIFEACGLRFKPNKGNCLVLVFEARLVGVVSCVILSFPQISALVLRVSRNLTQEDTRQPQDSTPE